jgi:PAS domain S-box-containing protein
MNSFWPYILLAACLAAFTGVMVLTLKQRRFSSAGANNGAIQPFPYSRRLKSLRIIMAVFGSLILAIGLAGSIFEEERVRDKHFSELETIAQTVASGFNYALLAPLTFTVNDTGNVVYDHITEQLRIVASHYEHTQIYTMVMRDSLIIFGPCSQSEAFSLRVLPGEVYQNPPEGLTALFESGKGLLVDPYEDEYGYSVSAFAPVFHPLSSTPAMIIGVDMDAKPFDREKEMASIRPLVFTLLLLLFLLGGAFYLTQRSVLEFQRSQWWQSPEAVFTFLFGLAIGSLVVWFSFTYETRYRHAIFTQSSTFYASRIHAYFRFFDASLERTFHQSHTQNPIDEALFSQRTAHLKNYNFVDAFGLAVGKEGRDAKCQWEILHYFEMSSGRALTNDCLEHLLSNATEKIGMAQKTGFRGIEFSDNDLLISHQAIVYQPIANDSLETEMLLFVILSPQALLDAAIASYGEAGYFNIEWLEYLEVGSQNRIAQSEIPFALNNCSIKMDRQHPVFLFGRVFVLSMQPGPAFIATNPQRVLFIIIPMVLIMLFLTTLIIGVLTTEKYRLERVVDQRTAELEASQNRFSLLFNSALEGIVLHRVVRDAGGQIVDYTIEEVNPAFSRLVGLTEDEVRGRLASEVYGNNGVAPYLSIYARVVETGHSERFNDFNKPLNRHFDVSVTLIKTDHFATVFSDISEIESAAAALRKSEENYRLLVENQNDLVIKVDLKGQYLYASPSFCRFFGKQEIDILGKVFIPQIDESDLVSSFKALKDLTSPPYRVSFEQKVKSAQGWRWVAWSNSAIFENDEVVGFIGIGREVTKRKRSELALENNQRKLQEQNDEYLALNEEYQALNEELHNTNNELLNAIEKAQESERLKTAFLQNMSHEIRTPLNAVIGFSEMMSLSGFSDEERDEFAEIVVNNSRQLLSLVDDIMTISTIETQQNKLSESRLHVSSLLSELHAVFAGNLKVGVDLEILLPEGDQSGFTIIADEMKLRQIFNNLIGNALKFTHEGSISFGYDLNQDSYIRFFVKDTGIGILPEVQDKIFERFRQAGENIQKRYGGTGLGLAISKGQVDLMGGRIWVESEIGKGSVFYFEIPLHQPEA